MTKPLSVTIGQYSDRGKKDVNQDFYGACVPNEPLISTKGIAIAIADGISSSDVSQVASQTAVKAFLEDYFCTAESWSVKGAATRVLLANNSWLFGQNTSNHEYRLNRDKGYVCTFSALILKSNTAHLFHVGDSQIARISGQRLEPLTEAHRVHVSEGKSYLARALGASQNLDIDYHQLAIDVGDTFVLTTDGIHETVNDKTVCQLIEQHNSNLDLAAELIAKHALESGSDDNLTVQIVRIDSLPTLAAGELHQQLNTLPYPPELHARMEFDGFEIIRSLHASNRSHVVLAKDIETGTQVALKLPSIEGRQDPHYIDRFLMEEWVANRLNNAHVIKSFNTERRRNYLYIAMEYIQGQTLNQWMIDNPQPSLEEVRGIIEQIARGLRAFHRQEMLHQDIRPNNIMIDQSGTVKIIDLGSTFVTGIEEIQASPTPQWTMGTAQFIAPEYLLGEYGTKQSDLYSLACISYHMLTGQSPYGTAVAKTRTVTEQRRLVYQSAHSQQRNIPNWLDLTLKKGLQAEPHKRYTALSEFVHDLRHPNSKFVSQTRPPLIERNPARFWQGVSALLLVTLIAVLLSS